MENQETFRREVANWLEENCPPAMREPARPEDLYNGGSKGEFPCEDAHLWFERMLARGWTAPDWPEEYGGAGLNKDESKILKQEMKRLGCRPALAAGQGLAMLGPALLEYGTEQQKREHLPKIARGEVRWCQGYSEPGAGSDLANIQCKAEDKGDHFLVNGTKIWTSNADAADWIFCLVRTDSEAPKHEGISFVLMDMAQQGVSVSPIELISGDSDFCQTFFDNARVEKRNMLGEQNRGWGVAKRLLQHERTLMSELSELAVGPRYSPSEVARRYLPMADGKLLDGNLRQQLTQYDMDAMVMGLAKQKAFEEGRQGTLDPNTTSFFKYYATELDQRCSELKLALMGTQGLGWEGEGFDSDELMEARHWAHSKILTIAGGSSEIQLNVVAKRVLQLPD